MRPRLTATIVVTALAALSLGTAPVRYAPAVLTPDQISRAETYLEEYWVPLPEGWTWHKHRFDGGYVRWGESGPRTAPTVLFVPGYTGVIELYTHYYARWRERGYRVVAMDLPGQGGSVRKLPDPERPWTDDFSHYGDVLRDFVAKVAEETEGPLILVGESFGGHVVLRAAADGPLDADAIVLNTPALEVQTPGFNPRLARGMTGAATWLGYGHRLAPLQSTWQPNFGPVDRETYRCGVREDRVYLHTSLFGLNPHWRVSGPSNEWLTGLERSGRRLAAGQGLADLDTPITLVIAGKDEVIVNDRAITACEQHLPNCRIVEIAEAGHCIHLEPDTVQVRALDETIAALLHR